MGFFDNLPTSPYSAPFTGPDEQRRRALALEIEQAKKGQGVASPEAIAQAQQDQAKEFQAISDAAMENQRRVEQQELTKHLAKEQLRKAGLKEDTAPLALAAPLAVHPPSATSAPGAPSVGAPFPSNSQLGLGVDPLARTYAEDARRVNADAPPAFSAYRNRDGKIVFTNQPAESRPEGSTQIDYKDAVRGVREATRERARETLAMPTTSSRELGSYGRESTIGIGPSQDLRNFAQELLTRDPNVEGTVSIPQTYEGPLAAQLQHDQLIGDMRRQLEFEQGKLALEQSKDLQGKTPEERAYIASLNAIYQQPGGIGQDAARLQAIERWIGEPSEMEILQERQNVFDAISKDPNALKMFNGPNDPKLLTLARKALMDRKMQEIQERLAAFSSKDRIASAQNQF